MLAVSSRVRSEKSKASVMYSYIKGKPGECNAQSDHNADAGVKGTYCSRSCGGREQLATWASMAVPPLPSLTKARTMLRKAIW